MKENERLIEIDLLRGLAMVLMIINHVVAYFFSQAIPLALWEITQSSAQLFIFCSCFLFFYKTKNHAPSETFAYLKKRIWRLLSPYYIFLLLFFPFIYFFEPAKLTLSFVLENIFLTGGIDINWLVVLVIQFAILLPFITMLWHKKRMWFWVYAVVAIVSTILLLFISYPYEYKLMMWLPWSVLALFSMWFAYHKDRSQFFFQAFVGSLAVFALSFIVLDLQDKSLSFYNNKYPPNLYLIAYGAVSSVVFYVLGQKIKLPKPIENGLHFMSRYSYSIYFIHYVVIYIVAKTILYTHNLNWGQFFVVVMTLTLLVRYLFLKLHLFIDKKGNFLP